jgi:putative spermidine/putrescine transport system substrate-binding protein
VNERDVLSRRELLAKAGSAAAGVAGLSLLAGCGSQDEPADVSAPAVETSPAPFTGTLRVLGLSLDLQDQLKEAAERAIGTKLAFEVSFSTLMVQRALTEPGSFDIFSGYSYQIDQVWAEGNLIGIDRSRIARWPEVTSLYKLGKLEPGCSVGQGDAPFRRLYATKVHQPGEIVQWGADDGSGPSDDAVEPPAVTAVPTTYSVESLGYRTDDLPLPPEQVSWGELLNGRWKGRVALMNDPGVGLQDAALAAEATGVMTVADKGNMTREEIDALVKLLLDLKRNGHFRSFWATFDESVDLLAGGETAIQSMWAAGVYLLQGQGYPVRCGAPVEGSRAWAGGLSFSRDVLKDPARLQACYDYANWWQSGLPGAFLMRLGYYSAVPETSRDFMSDDEWAYWVEGKPVANDLESTYGTIREGRMRDGGSLEQRSCDIAVWLSHFDEAEYQVQRWNELLDG